MSTPDPSPTEEELEAMLKQVEFAGTSITLYAPEAKRLIHALRAARESAHVATRERDVYRINAVEEMKMRLALEERFAKIIDACDAARLPPAIVEERVGAALAQLTDRDRMIAGLVHAAKDALDCRATVNQDEIVQRLRAALDDARSQFQMISDQLDDVPNGRAVIAQKFADDGLTKARDALAAAPPGEYEQRVRASALEEAAKRIETITLSSESDRIYAAYAIRALASKETEARAIAIGFEVTREMQHEKDEEDE